MAPCALGLFTATFLRSHWAGRGQELLVRVLNKKEQAGAEYTGFPDIREVEGECWVSKWSGWSWVWLRKADHWSKKEIFFF